MINKIKTNLFFIIFFIVSTILIVYGAYIDFSNFGTPNIKNYMGLALSIGASFLGVIFVILEVKARISMFVVGILGAFCSILYLYFFSPLIWDLAIAIVYIILNAYGLYYYSEKRYHNHQLLIKTLSAKEIIGYTVIGIIGIVTLSLLGIRWSRYSSLIQAIGDASTTIISIIGQWLLSKKYLEIWYLWILTNTISIPLYISINSYVYAMVFVSYLSISFYGLYTWKKILLSK
ncbi:MAG: nicotinamide riboside transporter PnuC [Brevinema sp.]